MKIYLAGRYSRHPEMRDYRDQLEAHGHKVTSRWIDLHGGDLGQSIPPARLNADPASCTRFAETDLLDLTQSDMVISFTEKNPGGKGGRHVEFGIGLAQRKIMIIIGPREHVFHTLSGVGIYPDWKVFVRTTRILEDGLWLGRVWQGGPGK
jgi:hypothetical protein